MKTVSAVFSLLAVGMSAAPDPSFTPGRITLPPLSLRESTKAPVPPTAAPPVPGFGVPRTHHALRPKPRMRIIEPRTNPDPHMAFTPDPAIDYKLRILRPSEMAPGR